MRLIFERSHILSIGSEYLISYTLTQIDEIYSTTRYNSRNQTKLLLKSKQTELFRLIRFGDGII